MDMSKTNEQEITLWSAEYWDRHDTNHLVEKVLTGEDLHVYTWEGFVVISPKPLSIIAWKRAVVQDQLESAREELKSYGPSPTLEQVVEVWSSNYVSANNIGRIAKQEGIKLPRHWFRNREKAFVTLPVPCPTCGLTPARAEASNE
jgi:hypothetical protein